MKKEQTEAAFVELPYREPAGVRELFGHFADEPWALLLDSGKTLHQAAQFDIILTRPRATYAFSDGESNITGAEIQISADPFETLKRFYEFGLKDAQTLPAELSQLPFHGGIAGYCSYDAGRYVEKLPSLAEDDIELPELAFGLYEWAYISDHKNHTSFLVKFCSYCDAYWKDIIAEFEKLYEEGVNSTKEEFGLTSAWQSNITNFSPRTLTFMIN